MALLSRELDGDCELDLGPALGLVHQGLEILANLADQLGATAEHEELEEVQAGRVHAFRHQAQSQPNLATGVEAGVLERQPHNLVGEDALELVEVGLPCRHVMVGASHVEGCFGVVVGGASGLGHARSSACLTASSASCRDLSSLRFSPMTRLAAVRARSTACRRSSLTAACRSRSISSRALTTINSAWTLACLRASSWISVARRSARVMISRASAAAASIVLSALAWLALTEATASCASSRLWLILSWRASIVRKITPKA